MNNAPTSTLCSFFCHPQPKKKKVKWNLPLLHEPWVSLLQDSTLLFDVWQVREKGVVEGGCTFHPADGILKGKKECRCMHVHIFEDFATVWVKKREKYPSYSHVLSVKLLFLSRWLGLASDAKGNPWAKIQDTGRTTKFMQSLFSRISSERLQLLIKLLTTISQSKPAFYYLI